LKNRFAGRNVIIMTEDEAREKGATGSLRGKFELTKLDHDYFSDILRECRAYFDIIFKIVLKTTLKFEIEPRLKQDGSSETKVRPR